MWLVLTKKEGVCDEAEMYMGAGCLGSLAKKAVRIMAGFREMVIGLDFCTEKLTRPLE